MFVFKLYLVDASGERVNLSHSHGTYGDNSVKSFLDGYTMAMEKATMEFGEGCMLRDMNAYFVGEKGTPDVKTTT